MHGTVTVTNVVVQSLLKICSTVSTAALVNGSVTAVLGVNEKGSTTAIDDGEM